MTEHAHCHHDAALGPHGMMVTDPVCRMKVDMRFDRPVISCALRRIAIDPQRITIISMGPMSIVRICESGMRV